MVSEVQHQHGQATGLIMIPLPVHLCPDRSPSLHSSRHDADGWWHPTVFLSNHHHTLCWQQINLTQYLLHWRFFLRSCHTPYSLHPSPFQSIPIQRKSYLEDFHLLLFLMPSLYFKKQLISVITFCFPFLLVLSSPFLFCCFSSLWLSIQK